MPSLGRWLLTFGLPSIASILVTFLILRLLSVSRLRGDMKTDVDSRPLSRPGKLTLAGIALLAATLMTASSFNADLGAPALAVAIVMAMVISFQDHAMPKKIARDVSWSVIPLVTGLFVIVEGMTNAGAQQLAMKALQEMRSWRPLASGMSAAFGVALLSNVLNNLPSGLIAGAAVHSAQITGVLRDTVLIGVDLGPNLSVSGSLATILWLIAIKREGQEVGFWRFLKWGALVMTPTLVFTILTLLIRSR
ncbi:MAG: hypothetical protein JO210_18545 [Acidobacteriaceae bacterium]|nr:hypothetical protein [Acidobacteriaceae bacterium]